VSTASRPRGVHHEEDAEPGSVTGKPLWWLRLDGLTLLGATLALFATTHQPWWLVPAVILLPDLFMVGYLGGTRVGAFVYNLGHSYPLPAIMTLAGVAGHHPLTIALGLLWLAHIGMDRVARYGLKYDDSFQHTHLSAPSGKGPSRSRAS
jgi:hypothetical protein